MWSKDLTTVKVGVVGMGLIGGSILLRLREIGIDVTGWDPDQDTVGYARAEEIHAFDRMEEAVAGRDLVFLGGPLALLPASLAQVMAHAPEHCVVTDVGSTKSEIAEAAANGGWSGSFLPGHPMAGTEQAGLRHAGPALLTGAAWVLCPADEFPLDRLRQITALLIQVFEARVVPMNPAAHDSVVALSSHIPHILAGGLAGGASESPVPQAVLGLAAGSFRDGTRVAGTPSERTADMLINNRSAVARQFGYIQEFLDGLTAAIRADDRDDLLARLRRSRDFRLQLLSRSLVPTDRTFHPDGPGDEERAFLRGIGDVGGYVNGCDIEPESVTYQCLIPAPRGLGQGSSAP